MDFLPINKKEMASFGWDEIDIILVTGDAYIDHPAFGVAILGRFLQSKGYRVGIIPQPEKDDDYQALGRPKLFFGVSSGNVDSMVCHYTAQKKIRSEDDFTPNNKAGVRPDRAVLVYTQKIKQLFKDIPVVIGGTEASNRRIPHYDYWSNKVKNSILIDSKATILVYGNGERQIEAIAYNIANSKPILDIRGTCVLAKEKPPTGVKLTDFSTVSTPDNFYKMTKVFYENFTTQTLYYKHNERYLIHYPPAVPLSTSEIDTVYNLPFCREPHPKYKGKFIKAFEQIKYSVLSHRGCYGGCSFCSIGISQGKTIQNRSKESILAELKAINQKPYFKGTITDIAGASANMYGTFCKAKISHTCLKQSCLYPEICPNLVFNDKPYIALLKAASQVKGIKNVFISSGVRFDLALKQHDFIQDLCVFYTSGLLKLAPEHNHPAVLSLMYKPSFQKYQQFAGVYFDICKKLSKQQFIIPYLIVGFPGCTLADAFKLHEYLKQNNMHIEQIQEFTPTPMTIATMMYYTGINYYNGQQIYVPKGRDIRLQKALAQWFIKDNKKLVAEAFKKLEIRN
ncbi:MAG: YgiQ family radical SAM protein [Candidatus Cloacimonetes bacterium]|nr:YgiQ family radical SAM protein [Candidatus Cloacimonadota bacterium]